MQHQFALLEDERWFQICLPGPDTPHLKACGIFSEIATDGKDEVKLCLDLCQNMNRLFDHAGAEYVMHVAGSPSADHAETELRPARALCMYKRDCPWDRSLVLEAHIASHRKPSGSMDSTVSAAVGLDVAMQEEHTSDFHGDVAKPSQVEQLGQGHVSWQWLTSLINVKTDPRQAPYAVSDAGQLILTDTRRAREARAQMGQHAATIMQRQHRTFALTAMIVQRHAFLVRWDRAGAIAARPFDYIKEPEKLLRFIYRIAVADRSSQGYDPTVTPASTEEIARLRTYRDNLASESPYCKYLDEILDNTGNYPIHKALCVDAEEPNIEAAISNLTGQPKRTHAFLVGIPQHGSGSLVGRGGKGFVAYDMDRGRSVFLKDYWYAVHDHPETEAYKKLAEKKVRFVATLLAGGDVCDSSSAKQVTLTQKYLAGARKPAKRKHHRLVVKEVGRPLETYRSGGELYLALYEALIAHQEAYENANILHGDVSMSNILIDIETEHAFLNDWDLCKYEDDTDKETSRWHVRTGTWPYMSATMVTFPRKSNHLADDIESFLYVTTLALLRFHAHSLTHTRDAINIPLTEHVHITYYSADKTTDGYYVGDKRKLKNIRNGDPDFELKEQSSPLATLLARLFQLGKEHYERVDFKELEQQWGVVDEEVIPPVEQDGWYHVTLPVSSASVESRNLQVGGILTPSTPCDTTARSPDDHDSAHPQVQAPAPQSPSRDFNNHRHILAVFESIPKDTKWRAKDKLEDQFKGVVPYGQLMSTGHGSKWSSQELGSGTESAAKRSEVFRSVKSGLQPVEEAVGSHSSTS